MVDSVVKVKVIRVADLRGALGILDPPLHSLCRANFFSLMLSEHTCVPPVSVFCLSVPFCLSEPMVFLYIPCTCIMGVQP